MNNATGQGEPMTAMLETMYESTVAYLPQLAGALVVILVGWLAARLLRALTVRLSRGLERFARSIGFERVLGDFRVSEQTAALLATIVYWAAILIVITIAANLLGLTLFSVWLDQLVGYLPRLFSAAIVVLVGVVISNLVRGSVLALTQSIPLTQRAMLARAAQVLILTVTFIIGVDQIGFDVTLVNTIFAVVVAAFLGGLSMAFGLGARSFVGNLLGVRYLGGDVRVGQRIRIDGIDGTVVDVTQTSIVLETEDGRTRVPGRLFSDSPILIIDREGTDG